MEVQRQAERQEQEGARLEHELQRSQAELERRKRAPARAASRASRPWWRIEDDSYPVEEVAVVWSARVLATLVLLAVIAGVAGVVFAVLPQLG